MAQTATREREGTIQAQPEDSKGALTQQPERKPPSPAEVLRDQMERQKPEFELVLPPGVTVDRFVRTIMTAVQADPDLMDADRKSLLQSAMQAAQDGLLPDKREGAFVIYKTKVKIDNREEWIKKVQWMPMIRGIIKTARKGGEISTLSARVVYENDVFEYILGDEERITHEPTLKDRGKMIACYAIAKMNDSEREREVMSAEDVMAVKGASKSSTGPWTGPFESEMWRKTVIRRLLKRLPMSTELERIISRDDSQYDFKDNIGNRFQQRESITAPSAPAPRREDFAEQVTIEATAEAGPIDIADQLESAIENAPDAVELSAIWATASRDGDLSAIKEADPARHGRLCEIYNATQQAFSDALASSTTDDNSHAARDPEPDDEDATRKQDDDSGKTNDAAGEAEMSEDDPDVAVNFTRKALATLTGLKTANAINNWYDGEFLPARKKHGLSDEQVNVVDNKRIARLKAIQGSK